jgi:sucrose phosphorylase
MMALQGIPAFYIHSLLATHNYREGVKETGRARTINRRKWELDDLMASCREDEQRAHVFDELKRRISIRKAWKIFHPDNPQQIIDGGKEVFIVKRYNENEEELVSIANMTSGEVSLSWHTPYSDKPPRVDLLSGKHFSEGEMIRLEPYEVVWLVREY